jgi:hypothetical protein
MSSFQVPLNERAGAAILTLTGNMLSSLELRKIAEPPEPAAFLA